MEFFSDTEGYAPYVGMASQIVNCDSGEPSDSDTGGDSRMVDGYGGDPSDNNNCEESNFNGVEPIIAPYIGMEFHTDGDGYDFYLAYALKTGFGVRKNSTMKARNLDVIISRIFVCSKEGQTCSKPSKENCNRSITRNGCEAKMKIARTNSGTWRVSQFVEEHNSHELLSPNKVIKHRSHRRLHRTKTVRTLIDGLLDQGLGPAMIAKVVNEISQSQPGTVTMKQCHEQLRIARKNNIGRECVTVVNNFQDRRVYDPNFYFVMEVDDDRTLRSVFWADGRSRASYMHFCDVIVFDVTYMTNKFNLPFAPFTGVNHHRQSTLFGCALLADETEETFVWLFQEWLKCMCGKAPGAILTDQDLAICNAIARVFPQTRHRYCKWHLDKHITEHMVHLKSQNGSDIEDEFLKLYYCDSVIDSERYWDELMAKYSFEKNSYLIKLWDKREHWIPCYFKDIFMAGMRTTQRSESMNLFFDGFVHSLTPLTEFVKQYDNAVASRRAAEEDEDFKTLNSEPVLCLRNKMEVQAAKCYSRKMFYIFQRELKKGISLWCEKVTKVGNVSKYVVGADDRERIYWKTVTFDDYSGIIISCDCAKFEMEGVLCRLTLKILNKKRVAEIPECYILRRWTPKLRYKMTEFEGCSSDTITDVTQLRKYSIRAKINNLLEETTSDTILGGVDSYLSNVLEEVRKQNEPSKVIEASSQVDSIPHHVSEIYVRDPLGPAKGKGRPRGATRIVSGLEQSQLESKKRTCGFCKEKGHYKTGCSLAKAAAAAVAAADQVGI